MNTMSRIDNSIRNVKYTAVAQAVNFLIVFISRKIFLRILSTEYLGLNGTFSNIITMLSLAELGLGSAICFCLYKPIYNKNEKLINSIMAFYKKAYNIIGLAVLFIGTFLIPFLDFIVEELPDIHHIRTIYFLFVLNSASSYFFVYKKTLLIADQKQYISNVIHQTAVFFINLFQIFFLLITRNYFSYLIIMVLGTLIQNIVVSAIVDRKYKFLDYKNAEPLSKEEKKEIFKQIGAMSSHRIGGVVVNGTDNLIIAKCINVISVGYYSNYYLIKNTIISVITLLFQSVTSSVGNLGARENSEKRKAEVFDMLYLLAAMIIGFCSIALFILFNPFIEIWVGKELLLDFKTMLIIVINFYMLGMRQPVLCVRDALGIFWYDRYKPIFEAVLNIVFSIPLAFKFGIFGVLLGTLLSTILTSFWVEPKVLYKYGFKKKLYSYFVKYFVYLIVTVITAFICYFAVSFINSGNQYFDLLLKALTCVVISAIVFLIVYSQFKEFRMLLNIFKNKIIKRKWDSDV